MLDGDCDDDGTAFPNNKRGVVVLDESLYSFIRVILPSSTTGRPEL